MHRRHIAHLQIGVDLETVFEYGCWLWLLLGVLYISRSHTSDNVDVSISCLGRGSSSWNRGFELMVDEAAFVKAQQVQTVGLMGQMVQSVASFAHLFVIVTELGLYALIFNYACVRNLDAVMGADHVLEVRCVQKRVIDDRVKVVWSDFRFFEQAKCLLTLHKRLWLHDWFFLCGEVNLCLDKAIVFLEQSM